jgi:membrane protein implicated in regulation of membrane protease activity
MRRHLKQRFWANDGDPGALAWFIASISLVLPVVAAVMLLLGGSALVRGSVGGWPLLGAGVAVLIIDIVIDFAWAHPGVTESDQPVLNMRGQQLVGRSATVVEAIRDGRGRVEVGDSIWAAEGPDLESGTVVHVLASDSTVLRVDVAPATD